MHGKMSTLGAGDRLIEQPMSITAVVVSGLRPSLMSFLIPFFTKVRRRFWIFGGRRWASSLSRFLRILDNEYLYPIFLGNVKGCFWEHDSACPVASSGTFPKLPQLSLKTC